LVFSKQKGQSLWPQLSLFLSSEKFFFCTKLKGRENRKFSELDRSHAALIDFTPCFLSLYEKIIAPFRLGVKKKAVVGNLGGRESLISSWVEKQDMKNCRAINPFNFCPNE